jgi:hypothetical protein
MNIIDFYNYPSGKGNIAVNIISVRREFLARYDKLKELMSHKVYLIDKYIYIVVKVPSSVSGIYYDGVIKFKPSNKAGNFSIYNRDIECFSNSPSFLFTYANAYIKRRLFIMELRKKLSSQILKSIAETRNPYQIISYDFSIYATLRYIMDNRLVYIESLNSQGIKCKIGDLYKNIQDAEKLQKDRGIQRNFNKMEEEKEIKEKKKFMSTQRDNDVQFSNIKNVNGIKSKSDVKKVNKIKRK